MPFDHRPEIPSPDLLEKARLDLANRLGLDPGLLHWKVGQRLDRKRSTLFQLALALPSGPVATAWYKTPYFPANDQDSRHLDRMRDALIRSDEMGRQFMKRVGSLPVSVNVTLAFDDDSLEVMTLGLDGEPMGNPLRLYVTSRGRERALAACAAVGGAIRIVETLPHEGLTSELGRIWQDTERKLESVGPLLADADRRSLERAIGELFESASREPNGVTLAHGDLSPGNVILMKDGITGLIDFMWIPQFRGFDLSRFIHRLRYTTASYRPWTSALSDAVLEGYGDRDAAAKPGWRFSEIQRLLATIQRLERKGEGGRRSAGRALAEIRAGL